MGQEREALAYLADPENWLGDPHDQAATLHGHDTPYELAGAALAAHEEPRTDVLIEVEQLDTAGLVRVQLSLDDHAHLLSPSTAQGLGRRLIAAAMDVLGEDTERPDERQWTLEARYDEHAGQHYFKLIGPEPKGPETITVVEVSS
jgi:hypothetical protein